MAFDIESKIGSGGGHSPDYLPPDVSGASPNTNPIIDLPFGQQIHEAVSSYLAENPSGTHAHIRQILTAATGSSYMRPERFASFISTVEAYSRIRFLGRGMCWIGEPIDVDTGLETKVPKKARVEVVEGQNPFDRHIVVEGSIDDLLRVWKLNATPVGYKETNRHRNHAKKLADMND